MSMNQQQLEAFVQSGFAQAAFCGDLGIRPTACGPGWVETELAILPRHSQQNGFVHGRYNRIIDEEWTAEVFFQWQSNIPMRIAQRYNVGLGPRYMAVDSEGLKFFISPLVMYELDVDYVTGAYESAFRMSTYLSLIHI